MLSTPIIASTPSISIILLPTSPHTLSSLRAKRSNPLTSPPAGEVADLSAGEGNLKNLQIVFSKRTRDKSFSDLFRESCVSRHLCNNKTNLLHKFAGYGQRIGLSLKACQISKLSTNLARSMIKRKRCSGSFPIKRST